MKRLRAMRWGAAGMSAVLGASLASGALAQAGAQPAKPATVAPAPAKPAPARPAPMRPTPKRPVINPRLPKETQAQQLALYAEELQELGKYAEAAPVLQEAAELTPEDWELWEKAGWGHLDAGQAVPALKAFEAARKAAPKGVALSGGYLVAQFALGNQKEVLDGVKQTVAPDLVEPASSVISKGMAAKPRTPEWNFALGYLYVRVLGNRSRALGPLEAVVAAAPMNAEAWLYLVEVNQELARGQQEDAAAIKYLELAPETPDAYRIRAERFLVVNRPADAVAEYLTGIAKHPTSGELYYALARAYERGGRPKDAETLYTKLVTLAESQKLEALRAQARAQRAAFHTRQKNYAAAEAYYREAAQQAGATPTTWNNLGAVLALGGKWADAAKAYATAADRDEQARGTTDPLAREDLLAARYRAGVAWLAAGQKEPARTALLAAQKLKGVARTGPEGEVNAFLTWLAGPSDKGEALAYQKNDERWAAFVWRAEQEPGELEIRGKYSPSATAWRALLQQAQQANRDCWPAEYALARLYAAAGFSEEALGLLAEVVQGRTTWWAPYYAIGQYHAQRRQKDEGVSALRKVLQLAPECRPARSLLTRLNAVEDDDL